MKSSCLSAMNRGINSFIVVIGYPKNFFRFASCFYSILFKLLKSTLIITESAETISNLGFTLHISCVGVLLFNL